jgi:hypothetical protein
LTISKKYDIIILDKEKTMKEYQRIATPLIKDIDGRRIITKVKACDFCGK